MPPTGARRFVFDRLPSAWRPAASYHYFRVRSLLEPELSLVCGRLKAGDRAIDVGASEGVYTHAFTTTGALVEAFEPQPDHFRVLDSYARSRQGVRAHAQALGAEARRAPLHVPMENGRLVSGHARLGDFSGDGRIYDVEVRTLDSYGFPDVAAIKIDVEGREMDVIAGAVETISRWRPLLLVEIEQRHLPTPVTEAFAAIRDLGYEGSFLHPEKGLLPVAEFDVATYQKPDDADRMRSVYINNFIFSAR